MIDYNSHIGLNRAVSSILEVCFTKDKPSGMMSRSSRVAQSKETLLSAEAKLEIGLDTSVVLFILILTV